MESDFFLAGRGEDGRGWKRMEEEERGGRRRQGEAEEDRRARSSPTSFIFSQTIQTLHLLGLLFD